MPFSPRSKGSRKGSKGGEEEYVVFLQGIPPQCRWQELKDLVRQTAHHIRQAVVYDDCHGRPTGLGQIIVKNEDEAWRTYYRLSTNGWDGHSLTVTLSLACAPTRPIAGPTRSPPAMRRHPYSRGYSRPSTATPSPSTPSPSASPEKPMMPYQWSPEYNPFFMNFTPGYLPLGHEANNSITYVMPLVFNNKGPFTLPTATTHPAEYEAYSQPNISCAPSSFQQPQPHEIYPNTATKPHRNDSIHSCDSSNASNRSNRSSLSAASATPTQPSRSVLIRNLKPSASWQNLREYLRAAGVVERCEVYYNRRSAQQSSSGTAKATFRSAEEAQKAVNLFDNSYFWGSRIRVALEEEVSAPGFTNGQHRNSNCAVANAGHELLAGAMSGLTVDSVAEEEKAKVDGPLVVNGSSVGAKTNQTSKLVVQVFLLS
ncbi:hypothetical protein FQN54_008262 [Arachnomyces sp. PD_36]|nr:hypothetical protein FQN54_008262 [Arachnomyces sp. PD_36]